MKTEDPSTQTLLNFDKCLEILDFLKSKAKTEEEDFEDRGRVAISSQILKNDF